MEIKSLLHYGVLAPSSHNSQPWAFKIGENNLEIYADFKRKLKEGDKDGRMLFVSLGCLITNLKIAADYLGLAYDFNYLSEPTGLAAIMNFRGEKEKSEKYFKAIAERRSNRNRYKDMLIPEPNLKELENLNCEKSLRINFITGQELKSKIAEISSQAMGQAMSNRNFRRELASWLRTNLTMKKDGMPGNGHGISLLVSFIAPFILRHVNVSKVEAKKEKKRIMNFPAVGIISSKENNPASWLKTGELLEMILLAAQSRGIDSAIRVAAIENQEAREKLKNALNLKGFLPQMLFGLGYAEKEAPHSPRRKIEDFIIS
ncbi:MAG: nitroreductase family protein [Candidatus Nealsonbacteria bacterium]|nr:nitroreductase family protein [Candidatus Nealsonbacteria bacterium]